MSTFPPRPLTWAQLTRKGIPEFAVFRRPLLWAGADLKPGDRFPVNETVSRTDLRQLYEQKRIAPLPEEKPLPVQASAPLKPVQPILRKHLR